MEIRCACGNQIFTKTMKLKKLVGQQEIHEETYYSCKNCGFTIAKKEVGNCPVVDDGIVLVREID